MDLSDAIIYKSIFGGSGGSSGGDITVYYYPKFYPEQIENLPKLPTEITGSINNYYKISDLIIPLSSLHDFIYLEAAPNGSDYFSIGTTTIESEYSRTASLDVNSDIDGVYSISGHLGSDIISINESASKMLAEFGFIVEPGAYAVSPVSEKMIICGSFTMIK